MTKKNLICGISIIIFLLCSVLGQAQSKQISKSFPVFNMQLTGGGTFSSSSVKKGEPAMIIYFSPTCDHCQNFITAIIKDIQSFKNYQIILVTYVAINEVKKFEEDYHLDKYKNIIAGSEGTEFKVRYFYNVSTFPFTAVYNKNLTLASVYRQTPAIDQLKKLQ